MVIAGVAQALAERAHILRMFQVTLCGEIR
jgi:hypothetical protein